MYVIGLNSGSSLDSIDAALLEMTLDGEGLPRLERVVATAEVLWPAVVHEQLLQAISLTMSIDALCRLNFVVGAVFADAAQEVLRQAHVDKNEVAVIGVDGQTIYQEPPDREHWTGHEGADPVQAYLEGRLGNTLQIGEGAVIAALTGIPAVNHFRPADIALGGTGAPIEQYLDYVHYRHQAPVITLNIGGIANIHAIHRERDKVMAFDTGPGNILMDRLAQFAFNQPYDKNGTIAASGEVKSDVLARLLAHPFLRRDPPRCAWREDFSAAYLQEILDAFPGVDHRDLMATLAEFTVQGVLRALGKVPFLTDVTVLVGNGGGIYNQAVKESLERQLPGHLRLTMSDEFGIPAKANEAAKFGTLGLATLHRLAGNFPHASGAASEAVLGDVHYPPQRAFRDTR